MYTQTDKIGLVLLGNKIDVTPRDVKLEEGLKMAEQYGIKHFETSALNNINVEESFRWLTEDIMTKKNIDVNQELKKGNISLDYSYHSTRVGEKKEGGCAC